MSTHYPLEEADTLRPLAPRLADVVGAIICRVGPDPSVENWENEGGRVATQSSEPDANRDTSFGPVLPPGFRAQQVRTFRDQTGRFQFCFFNVYGPARPLPGPALIMVGRLDEGLSYWAATGLSFDENGDERAPVRWMTYAQARKASRPPPSFERFSSQVLMRRELAELLKVGDGYQG